MSLFYGLYFKSNPALGEDSNLTGVACDLTSNDLNEAVRKDQISRHLEDIARAFSEGKFEAPMEIHDKTPPSVPVTQQMEVAIDFRFELTSPIVMENQPNNKALRVPATDARQNG